MVTTKVIDKKFDIHLMFTFEESKETLRELKALFIHLDKDLKRFNRLPSLELIRNALESEIDGIEYFMSQKP